MDGETSHRRAPRVWEILLSDLPRHPRILEGMAPREAFRLGLFHADEQEIHRRREIEALRQAGTAEAQA